MANPLFIKRIQIIQRYLQLDADGVIGPATLSAIENSIFGKTNKPTSSTSLTLSNRGFYQLIKHEIISKNYYQRRLQKPIWPGGASGVTIGIGYDLGYHRDYQIKRDWSPYLSDAEVNKLIRVASKKGSQVKSKLASLKDIRIPYDIAAKVFSESTLPRYAKNTFKTYKGIEKCLPDVQAAILSLVYNRGTRLSGSTRKEMKAIRSLISKQQYQEIADEILSMKRLWEGKGLNGLIKRREDEAKLILNASANYEWDSLIRV